MHSLMVRIPSFRFEDSAMEKGYTVFKIDVLTSGRQHSVEKRYSEFHSLHKKLKKFIKAPEMPSKHVRNWVPKVLEHRRLGLEIYLQRTTNPVVIKLEPRMPDHTECTLECLITLRHCMFPQQRRKMTKQLILYTLEACERVSANYQLLDDTRTIIMENEVLPKIFLEFLNIRHFPSLPKTESCGSFDETESEESSKLSHQPVLLFLRDPYVLPAADDTFPNVVIEGVVHGMFYPHIQPW